MSSLLGHIAIFVPDLQEAEDFIKTFLKWN